MQQISKLNKGFAFYYVLLIFLVNMYGLFLLKTKKALRLPILLKNFLDKPKGKPKKCQ